MNSTNVESTDSTCFLGVGLDGAQAEIVYVPAGNGGQPKPPSLAYSTGSIGMMAWRWAKNFLIFPCYVV